MGRAGRCEAKGMQSIAGGLLNSPSVSLKLYASASSVFLEFAFLMPRTACTNLHVYMSGCVCIHKMKGHLPILAWPTTYIEVKKRQRTKHSFPATDRPDMTEIGCFYS